MCLGGLCNKLDSAANLLDLALRKLGDEFGLDEQGLLGQLSLAKHLEDAMLGDIDDWCAAAVLGSIQACLQRPISSQLTEEAVLSNVMMQSDAACLELSQTIRGHCRAGPDLHGF